MAWHVKNVLLVAFLALSALALACCTSATPEEKQPPAEPTLYQRLGGEPAIRSIAEGWVDKIAQDPRVKSRFEGSNLNHFKLRLISQLGERTGGPQVYTGKSMGAAHKGMNISNEEWAAFMEDLKATLNELKIAPVEREQLLVILEPMRNEIVGH